MNGIFKSLPFRLLIGVAAGIVLGLWASGFAYGGQVMQVVLTLKELLGSLINFCVPLIIIGFIAPSITRLKQNASRMLALALVLAYTSSVCAALMSMAAGYASSPPYPSSRRRRVSTISLSCCSTWRSLRSCR